METGRLSGKVAVVTGASRGIGEAIARAMVTEGAKVVLASRKIEALTPIAEELSEHGEAAAIACHIGKPEDVMAFRDAVLERFGQVDVLVNNAATNPYFGPMMNLEWRAWDKTFDVNLKGTFAMTHWVAKHLIDRGAPGSIINISSVLGLMAAPLQGAYGMTKAAVLSMTKTLSAELGPSIRVNAIAPGLIDTKFASALTSNDEIREMILSQTAAKRVGQPEDITGAVIYLASDESRYMTGQTMIIDGGWL